MSLLAVSLLNVALRLLSLDREVLTHSEVLPHGEVLHHGEVLPHVETQVSNYEIFKRSFDLWLATLLLILLAPVIFFAALMIKTTTRGPVLYKQLRLTAGGREFWMYKFRTMSTNAEAVSGAVWATRSDPRITPVGRFLRISRVDELPQLLNVLRGDMSLIGPRPERPEMASKLQEELPSFNRRLEVKAGITGLAQVGHGYAACLKSYRRKLAFDRLYVKRRSVLLDLKIAARTILVVLTGRGAR